MKDIKYHNIDYLRNNNLVIKVDEEQVHFINGIAAVNATVYVNNRPRRNEKISGIINEEYQEVFNDEEQYGDERRNLMFLGYNTNILRCGENDFIVNVRQGDEYQYSYVNKHIRIKNMKAELINENIGVCIETNDKNILIIDGIHTKKLYSITKGKYIGTYSEISIIEGCPHCFTVKKHINSLTEEDKNKDLYLTDDLYFQIDQDGHIISKIFSQRKLDFLDYGNTDIDNYPLYCEQELIEESKKLKEAVYSLKKSIK